MAVLDLVGAVRYALHDEMRRDERVVVLGDGVGDMGGAFSATEGLLDEFGEARVLDVSVGEGGLIGAAIGMALYGLKPVVEVPFAEFAFAGFDQIVSELATYRYRSAGHYACPVVLRMPYGGGIGGGHYHSQSPEAHFAHTPGLTVVAPATAADAVGLLRSAIRGDDPVVFLEPKNLYRSVTGDIGDEDFTVPIGSAAQIGQGDDVTVVAYGSMSPAATAAAAVAAERGVAVDLLDLRTLVPMDIGALLESVARTGRVVLVQEAPKHGGYSAELAAILAEKALFHLQAPVLRVCGFDTPFPYALEKEYLPGADRILAAIERVANF